MKANGHKYTDEEVREHIEWLKEGAKSEELFDLIKYDRQKCANAFYWHQKIQDLLSRTVVVFVVIFLAVLGACCFYYWLATVLEPIHLAILAAPTAICMLFGFAYLSK